MVSHYKEDPRLYLEPLKHSWREPKMLQKTCACFNLWRKEKVVMLGKVSERMAQLWIKMKSFYYSRYIKGTTTSGIQMIKFSIISGQFFFTDFFLLTSLPFCLITSHLHCRISSFCKEELLELRFLTCLPNVAVPFVYSCCLPHLSSVFQLEGWRHVS